MQSKAGELCRSAWKRRGADTAGQLNKSESGAEITFRASFVSGFQRAFHYAAAESSFALDFPRGHYIGSID